MIISTTPNIEGKQVIQVLGIAVVILKIKKCCRDIFAALKNIGGEIDEFQNYKSSKRTSNNNER